MTIKTIFSALYLLISLFSLIMGHYAFSVNIKSRINRLFLLMSFCMTIWAFGFSIIFLVPDKDSAILWMRISAIGYVMLYSFLLNFIISFTGFKKLLGKWWAYIIIYIPAAVCLYSLVISPDITSLVYQIQLTDNGWVRSASQTIFDTIFNIYFIVYVLLSVALLVFWFKRSDSADVKKQGVFLLISIAAATSIGAFTDVYLESPILKMAPVLFLIPLCSIFYCIKRYHLMRKPQSNYPELALSDRNIKSVYQLAAIGLILGGIMVLMEYVWLQKTHSLFIVLAGAALFIIGVSLYWAQKAHRNEEFLELLLSIISLVVIPIVTIGTTDSSGLTVWALPVILIISSLVFNMRLLLFSAAASMLLSQVYLWGIAPESVKAVEYETYLVHIAILLFIIAASYCVHYIYNVRLKENAEQTRMQTLLSNVSVSFSGINAENFNDKKRNMINILAEYYRAEKVCVCSLDKEFLSFIPLLTFSTDGSEVPPDYEMICKNRWEDYVSSGNLDAFKTGRMEGFSDNVKQPWYFIPVFASDKPVGFIHLETAKSNTRRTKEQLIALQVVSRIASGALEKASGERRIWNMAYFDTLTKLPNRQLFNDRAEQIVHLARRTRSIAGIMFLDLDSFKAINDTLGHDGGDMLIKAVAGKLSSILRKSDTVARFGGDEFLILFSCVESVNDITAIADKVMNMFKEPIVVKGQKLFITASAGISFFPADGDDAQSLIKHADIAMYSAKEKGKNQYALCSGNMKDIVEQRMKLTTQLYRALENNEFEVYYQPQVCLQNGKIVGVEALLRWFNPKIGSISPTEFIPLAEQTGLINPIGNWVLQTACKQSVEWKRMGFDDIRMSVNLSVVQLRNSSLVSQIKSLLESTQIEPGLLELELTESATMHEPDYIVGVLNDLKNLGLTISIDDFGTEYSSLNRLKLLPIDRIKMDMQFVHGIDKSPKDQAITMVIINLAKNLDLKLVAEGVESSTQLHFLKQRMCDEVQGYYYYKPMPAADIEKILKAGTV